MHYSKHLFLFPIAWKLEEVKSHFYHEHGRYISNQHGKKRQYQELDLFRLIFYAIFEFLEHV